MGAPTIYCNTKQASAGEEITVIASIGSGEWSFPNVTSLSADIEIIEGDLESNVLIFKCLRDYDPLIVNFLVIDDTIINGSRWETINVEENIDILADNWTTPSDQENVVLTGWNFEGRSQRVNQTSSGVVPSISQANLTVSGGEYIAEIDYRASVDIELKVGGHTFELSATNEGPPFAIYPIQHGAGLVDFEVEGATGVKWLLADGSDEYSNSVYKTLPVGGTSYLIVDDFNGTSINSGNTDANYIGDLSDVPSGVAHINFENSGVTGDISEIAHVTDYVNLSNTDITGIIPQNMTVSEWHLDNTSLSKAELETSLVNVAFYAVTHGINNGVFHALDNMPTVDSAEACNALYILTDDYSWTVIINSNCGIY